ncbi:MAG: transmembrane Mn(2+) transporter [Solibacterales bacterium]|nr:transmembrane Mn(2+) transporter [Bryobacterales bacterium]|tara:strand:- start:1483 stop:3228 length:1746 start_codon:yes stop_codon:yes gene_type:complete
MAKVVPNKFSPPPDLRNKGDILDPPTRRRDILRSIGPGLIIAGSLVGSGELIATTKTGAQAGILLLWLIILGCVIKVFVQVEIGRHTITHGETILSALNRLPGPRIRVNWIVWYSFVMMAASIGGMGAVVGGVGQALALAFPITGDYSQAIQLPSELELKRYIAWGNDIGTGGGELAKLTADEQERIHLGQALFRDRLSRLDQKADRRGSRALVAVTDLIAAEHLNQDPTQASTATAKARVDALLEPITLDDQYWAVLVTLITVVLLYFGRYRLIQSLAIVLVGLFTLVTIGNVFTLQFHDTFRLSASEILSGLQFRLPPIGTVPPGIVDWQVVQPLATALMTFGIIGIGGMELGIYPYWCLEKGYARFTGPRTQEASWARRASGWMRVVRYDAFISMVLYTATTVAFFVMGVAVMHKQGLDPTGMRMVSTLLEQYVPAFGEYAHWLFLFGAIAVLGSTFLIGNAGIARLLTDALKVSRLIKSTEPKTHERTVVWFSVAQPIIALVIFATGVDLVGLVLFNGLVQALMLPLMGLAALHFRYREIDRRLMPGRWWDRMLLLSSLGLFIAGGWLAFSTLVRVF